MPANPPWTWIEHTALLASPGWRAVFVLSVGGLLALLTDQLGRRTMRRLAALTQTALDDALVQELGHLPGQSVLLGAVWYAFSGLPLPEAVHGVFGALLASLVVLIWTMAALRLGRVTLDHIAADPHRHGMLQVRTLPLFDILVKVVIASAAVYFLLLAWQIDVSAWVASAGIVGIAVGFAAKDTLANLIGGLSILADAPYKIGDYLVLEGGIRGRVTAIGLRSTRLLTRDDIEVILPNATMASANIINESGGPYEKERLRCPVQVAYSSDLDHVSRVLLEVAKSAELLVHDDPALQPRVRFRAFNDSGIAVELLGWIRQPESRGQALDQLIRSIHQRFREEGILIPFPQQEVRLLGSEAKD